MNDEAVYRTAPATPGLLKMFCLKIVKMIKNRYSEHKEHPGS